MSAARHALASDAEILARLADALHDLFAWAQRRDGEAAASGSSPVLRQRMADLWIEHRVAGAVLDEARGAPREDAAEQQRLTRRCVARCLRLAAEVIGDARGEPSVAWMREALAARREEAGRA